MTDAKRLGAAFRAGMAFAAGKKHCRFLGAQDADKWITVHPGGKGPKSDGSGNKKGTPVLIDGETGRVKGGMGGKFNGRHISAVPKRGKEEQHGAQMTIARSHQNKEGSATKAAVPAAQQKQEPKAEESVYQKLSRKGVRINEKAFERFPENVAK